MGAERGDLCLNRAAPGVAVLAVGCRHDEYDWFRVMLYWERRPQVMSHGNCSVHRARGILWTKR